MINYEACRAKEIIERDYHKMRDKKNLETPQCWKIYDLLRDWSSLISHQIM